MVRLGFWRRFFPPLRPAEEIKETLGHFGDTTPEAFQKSMREARPHIIRAGIVGFGVTSILTGALFMLMGLPTRSRMQRLEILHFERALSDYRERKEAILEGRVHDLPVEDERILKDLEQLKRYEEAKRAEQSSSAQ